jgi:hypothetical protein
MHSVIRSATQGECKYKQQEPQCYLPVPPNPCRENYVVVVITLSQLLWLLLLLLLLAGMMILIVLYLSSAIV